MTMPRIYLDVLDSGRGIRARREDAPTESIERGAFRLPCFWRHPVNHDKFIMYPSRGCFVGQFHWILGKRHSNGIYLAA